MKYIIIKNDNTKEVFIFVNSKQKKVQQQCFRVFLCIKLFHEIFTISSILIYIKIYIYLSLLIQFIKLNKIYHNKIASTQQITMINTHGEIKLIHQLSSSKRHNKINTNKQSPNQIQKQNYHFFSSSPKLSQYTQQITQHHKSFINKHKVNLIKLQNNYRNNLDKKIKLFQLFFSTQDNQQRIKIMNDWPHQNIKKFLNNNGIIFINNKIGCYYIGSISNNMLHGYGILLINKKIGLNELTNQNENISKNSRFYQGWFHNNIKHGTGFQYYYQKKQIYIGNYVNNRPEGLGIYIWKNQSKYQGQFLAGLKHGNGKLISSQETYIGQWNKNKPQGCGIIITLDYKYQGQIKQGLKNGQGKEYFKNGDIYQGNYVNGKPEGYGEYIWNKKSSYYRGIFKNGLRHGHGVWVQDGSRYQGEYLNDKKSGFGTFFWPSGNIYTGNFFNDLKHGYGQMTWNDGKWYKGQWKYGLQNGIGTMDSGKGPIKGVFQNNVLISEETFSASNIKKKIKKNRNIEKDEKIFQKQIYETQNRKRVHTSIVFRQNSPILFSGYKSKMQKEQIRNNNYQILKQRYLKKQKKKTFLPSMKKSNDFSQSIIKWTNMKEIQIGQFSKSFDRYNVETYS